MLRVRASSTAPKSTETLRCFFLLSGDSGVISDGKTAEMLRKTTQTGTAESTHAKTCGKRGGGADAKRARTVKQPDKSPKRWAAG